MFSLNHCRNAALFVTPAVLGCFTLSASAHGCDVFAFVGMHRVVVKSFPPTSTPLEALEEEERLYTDSINGGLSMENNLLFVAPGSSPFSLSKDVTHGTEGFEGEDQEGFDSTFEVSGSLEVLWVFMCVWCVVPVSVLCVYI